MTRGIDLRGLWLSQWGQRVHSSCGHIRAGPRAGKYGPQRRGPCSFLERSQHCSTPQHSRPGQMGCGLSCHTRGFPLNPTCLSMPPSSCLVSVPSTLQSHSFKLKLSTLTPKIIWHFYWDHTESIDVLRSWASVSPTPIHSLKPLSACPNSPPPASPSSSLPSPWAAGWGRGTRPFTV